MKVFKFIICTIIGIILFLLLNQYCNGFTVGAPFQINGQWWRNVYGNDHPGFEYNKKFRTMLELYAHAWEEAGITPRDLRIAGTGAGQPHVAGTPRQLPIDEVEWPHMEPEPAPWHWGGHRGIPMTWEQLLQLIPADGLTGPGGGPRAGTWGAVGRSILRGIRRRRDDHTLVRQSGLPATSPQRERANTPPRGTGTGRSATRSPQMRPTSPRPPFVVMPTPPVDREPLGGLPVGEDEPEAMTDQQDAANAAWRARNGEVREEALRIIKEKLVSVVPTIPPPPTHPAAHSDAVARNRSRQPRIDKKALQNIDEMMDVLNDIYPEIFEEVINMLPQTSYPSCRSLFTGGFDLTPIEGLPAMRWTKYSAPVWNEVARTTLNGAELQALAAGIPLHPNKLSNLAGTHRTVWSAPQPGPGPEGSDLHSEAALGVRLATSIFDMHGPSGLDPPAAVLFTPPLIDPDDDDGENEPEVMTGEQDDANAVWRELIRRDGVCTSTLPCVDPEHPDAGPPQQTTRVLDANFNSGVPDPYEIKESKFPRDIINKIAEMATGGWLFGKNDLEAVIRYGQAFSEVFIIYIEQIHAFYQEMGLQTIVMLFTDIMAGQAGAGVGFGEDTGVAPTIVKALIESIVIRMFRSDAPDTDMATYIGNQRNLINEVLDVVNKLLWRSVGFNMAIGGNNAGVDFVKKYDESIISNVVRFMQDTSNGFIGKLIKLMFLKGLRITWETIPGARSRMEPGVPVIVINMGDFLPDMRIVFDDHIVSPGWIFAEFVDIIVKLYSEFFDSDDLPVSRDFPS